MTIDPRVVCDGGAVLLVVPIEAPDGAQTELKFDRAGIIAAARQLGAGDHLVAADLMAQFDELFDQAEALARVKAVIDAAKKQKKKPKDPAAAYDAAADLALLPPSEYGKCKSELRQALGPALGLRELERAVKESRKSLRRERSRGKLGGRGMRLPEIRANGRQLRDMSDDALKSLSANNSPPEVFLRGGELVRVKMDERENHIIACLSEAGVKGVLERSANFFEENAQGERYVVSPPNEVVRDVMALDVNRQLGRIGARTIVPLEMIVESPTMRPDGTILTASGYDIATKVFYVPAQNMRGMTVPLNPTAEQVQAARGLIDEAVGDFPFADEASRANAWGFLITLFARSAISGRVPMAVFDKPQPGTGGSLLVEALSTIASGRDVPMEGAARHEDEWTKKITGLLMDGRASVIFDNVEHVLESDSLARVVTCAEWSDRKLGVNAPVRLQARTVWAATGNNITMGRNLSRRCFVIRLDAKQPRPFERTGFRHTPLIPWVKDNRPALVAAVLTICRAWYAAGMPPAESPVLGSFEEWSRIVGGILAFSAIPGFLDNYAQMLEESDEESVPWEAFLLAWIDKYAGKSVTVSQVESDLATSQRLRESLPSELAGLVEFRAKSGFSGDTVIVNPKFKLRFGKALRKRVGMQFGGGIHIESDGMDSHTKVSLWKVIAGSAGSGGSSLTLTCREKLHTHSANVNDLYGDGVKHSPQSPALPAIDEEAEEREAIADHRFN